MKVHQIINSFHTSNTYIIELSKDEILLIDVGNADQILDWLMNNKKSVHSVILTHEHSDHCHGINELYDYYKFDLYCSKPCAKNIANNRQNFSKYIEELETFEINIPSTIIISDYHKIDVLGREIFFIQTPGHSPGSICILIENNLFTGDTILNGIKTPLNLPHSSKEEYQKSIFKLQKYMKEGTTIFPGHGEVFSFQTLKNLELNNRKYNV